MKISNLPLEELLALKSNLTNKLKSIPFEGYIQIKENANKKYIYIRKKENNKTLSEYIGVYSDELFWAVSKSVKEGRKLKKEIALLNNQIKTLDGKKLLTESIEEAYEANVGPIDEDIN